MQSSLALRVRKAKLRPWASWPFLSRVAASGEVGAETAMVVKNERVMRTRADTESILDMLYISVFRKEVNGRYYLAKLKIVVNTEIRN